MRLTLELRLVSDTTFGNGEGVPGLVDTEVEHDSDGLPFLRGRGLKGLVVEECANLLYPLSITPHPRFQDLEAAAGWLFGQAGSTLADDGHVRIGPAQLPDDLRAAVHADVVAKRLDADDVLDSLTAIRRQTAVDPGRGAPDTGSLRATRVVLRETTFQSTLDLPEPPPNSLALPLLAGCIAASRRGGLGRNRGRGRLRARLLDELGHDLTPAQLDELERALIASTPAPGAGPSASRR